MKPIAATILAAALLAAVASTNASSPAEGPIRPSAVTSGSQGANHGCAILAPVSDLRCWGSNTSGQVGDGTTTNRAVPVTILPNIVQVATGSAHTCALSGGTVQCWGRNNHGQLGDGTTTDRLAPTTVVGLESVYVLSITAGFDHTCAVVSFGALRCWGRNNRGQLGDGTTITRLAPVAAIGNASSMSAGGEHTCARTFGDGARCWGRNSEGQLGDGTFTDRLTPVDVVAGQPLGGVLTVSAGAFHSCVTDENGGLLCWGSNANGQIGDNTTTTRAIPTYPIQLGTDMVAVAAGHNHSCGVRRDGTTLCWGANNGGQLGDGTVVQRLEPVEVVGIGQGGKTVQAGAIHSCVQTHLESLMCWGGNLSGELGDGGFNSRTRPANVAGLAGVATIRAGLRHTCAITAGSRFACWGANNLGQLGDGTAIARDMPKMLDGYVAQILTVGSNHVCTGGLCWGDNAQGQYGNGETTSNSFPTSQPHLSNTADVAAGELSTCRLTTNGAVQCWGANAFGALGDGTSTDRLSPVTVSGFASGAAGLSMGSYHGCAVTQAGGVRCWGSGSSGELGNGGLADSNVPVQVTGLTSGVTAVAAGATFSCALTTAGGVKCWGGNVTSVFRQTTPVDIEGLTFGVTGISAGRLHVCARLATGAVKCWGDNTYGQVGDGTTTSRNAPVSVSGITTGAGVVAAGGDHTCVLMLSGKVQCWGRNLEGRLGDGTTTQRLTPVHAVTSLTIARTGSGTVVSVPPQFSCGATCTGNVPWGGQLRLIAMPTPATTFGGWTGGACFGTAPCDLTPYRATTVGAPFQFIAAPRSEFNGDGRSDIFWRDSTGGLNYQYQMDGFTISGQGFLPSVPSNWMPAAQGDVDGDGKADVFWREAGGLNYLWTLDGLNVASQGYFPSVPPPWNVTGMGDANGDGRRDIFWRNASTGQNYLWMLDGLSIVSQGFLPSVTGSEWIMAAVDDFSGDGKADIFWRNQATGDNYLWVLDGLSITTQGFLPNVPTGWDVVASPNDGSGGAEVVWRNATTGANYYWRLEGFAIGYEDFMPPVSDTNWKIVGFGDFDGDGLGDLLWRNPATGQNYLWKMNGPFVITQGFLPSVSGTNWAPIK